MINRVLLKDKVIHGTNIQQYRYESDKYPRLSVSLVQAPLEPERLMAFAYMECIEDRLYENPGEIPMAEAKEIAKWVLEGGHTPALETIDLMFNIRGMSKVVSHQIVRHRIGVSIGQRTQRANSEEYLGKIFDRNHYITPPSILQNREARLEYDKIIYQMQETYKSLIELGIHQDEARYMIPQGSETAMTFNVIFKALMGVCNTRLCEMMQGELVEICRMMAQATKDYNEFMGAALMPICFKTGKCNRNENNPIEGYPKGVCVHTRNGTIPVREHTSNAYNLTQYSRSASEIGEKKDD